MIYDTAKNLDKYRKLGIGDRYEKAVNFLKTADLKSLPAGRFEIDGDNVYYMVSEYDSVPWDQSAYEAHEKYTDIQYVAAGSEIMTFSPVEGMTPSDAFDAQKDVVHYTNDKPGIRFVIDEGGYMIFMPGDVHKSKTQNGKSAPVKKIVVKIKEV